MGKVLPILAGVLVLGAAWAAFAEGAVGASTGVYSPAQAERGAALYTTNCARCHGTAMEGVDVAPPLSGPRFTGNWAGQTVGALASRIRTTMPDDAIGSLGLSDSADITVAILAANGYPAGKTDLPATTAALNAVTLDAVR